MAEVQTAMIMKKLNAADPTMVEGPRKTGFETRNPVKVRDFFLNDNYLGY